MNNHFLKSNLSDEDILHLHRKSGKISYLGELYNRYLPSIYGVCLKYLKKRFNAQEAALQLFDNLLHSISVYEIDAFQPWIYNVVKNHCLQILNKEEPKIKIDSIKEEIVVDNFLQDAIEGFDLIKKSSVKNDLDIMARQIRKKSKNKTNYKLIFYVVAFILMFFFISTYFLFFENKDQEDNIVFLEADVKKNDSASATVVIDEFIDENIIINEDNIKVKNPRKEQPNHRDYSLSNYDNYPLSYNNGQSISNIEVQEYLAGNNRSKEENIDSKNPSLNTVTAEPPKSNNEKKIQKLPDNTFDDKENKVILLFKVNEKGRPCDIILLRSLNQLADREAVRLLESGPDRIINNDYLRFEVTF